VGWGPGTESSLLLRSSGDQCLCQTKQKVDNNFILIHRSHAQLQGKLRLARWKLSIPNLIYNLITIIHERTQEPGKPNSKPLPLAGLASVTSLQTDDSWHAVTAIFGMMANRDKGFILWCHPFCRTAHQLQRILVKIHTSGPLLDSTDNTYNSKILWLVRTVLKIATHHFEIRQPPAGINSRQMRLDESEMVVMRGWMYSYLQSSPTLAR